MATARRSIYHESLMHHFKDAVRDCEIKAICGRTFIRVEKLKAWVSSHTESLLEAAYDIKSITHPALPISEDQICSSDRCSLLIFCILLEMDKGSLIHYFYRLGVGDLQLGYLDSFSLQQSLQESLERSPLSPEEGFNVKDFAKDFAECQWRYCPVKFEFEDMMDYKPQHIIPIHKKEAINDKGFTASVWQVEVLEEFIGRRLREEIATSRYTDERDGLGPRYNIAQKTFEEGKRVFFKDEVNAFKALKGRGGFVMYLGDYSHRQPDRDISSEKNTYNILLEYGERDLDEFFCDQSYLPPVQPAEIHKFWAEIFAIADAVKNIHSFKKRWDGAPREFYGWHADIKPDNILKVKDKFKLADPGFACFEVSEGEARLGSREKTTNIRGGTSTYGAPECHPGRKEKSPVPRSIDIWSLGCVFSVTATWVVLGVQGICQFTTLRESVIRRMIDQARLPQFKNDLVTLQSGDYFHDGETVLEVVLDWHKNLRNSTRRTDTITSKLLDFVDDHMLRKESEDRVSAKELCLKLESILNESQQQPIDPLPESLRQGLFQIDMSAPPPPTKTSALLDPKPVASGDGTIEGRKTRKSRLLDLPLMKTVHRSDVLTVMAKDAKPPVSSLARMPFSNALSLQAPRRPSDGSGSGAVAQSEAGAAPGMGHPYDRLNPPPRQHTSVMSFENVPSSREPRKQNMWQVHEEMRRRKSILFGKYPKDPEMSKFFECRDIQFLIDNADSMADHWAEAIFLLEALAMKASRQDDDGMDLCFTHGNVSAKGKKRPGPLIEKMKDSDAKPDHHGNRTDIRIKLDLLFRNYLSNVKRLGKMVRKLVIIIFTDGKWDGMLNKHAIENTIVRFVGKLRDSQDGYLDGRQVSFSFIQFGDDEDARYRLQRLDDELHLQGIPDIVDTEESRGDVKKMLVGSFDETYDSKNEFKPIPSNLGGNRDSYIDTESGPRNYILSQDQQSQSHTGMEPYGTHRISSRSRVDSGYSHPSPSQVHNH